METEISCLLQVLDVKPKGWKSVSQFVSSVALLGAALERGAKYLCVSKELKLLRSGCMSLIVQEGYLAQRQTQLLRWRHNTILWGIADMPWSSFSMQSSLL